METKWLEDFLSVAQTFNFSRSAKLRHVTQPAFCRRIRALENWVGAELFDRSRFPVRLSPAGEIFLTRAREMLDHSTTVRSVLRGQTADVQSRLTFAMPHTLSITYFPRWLAEVEQATGRISARLEAGNTHDAVMQLVEGNCDLLMCYHHPYQSIELDGDRYEMLVIGDELIAPYAKVGLDGLPIYRLPGSAANPLPFLSYSPNTVLGRVVERSISDDPRPVHLYRRFEGDLAVGLKTMTSHGHGIAWLPRSAVEQEVADGTLAIASGSAADVEGTTGASGPAPDWSGSMQIRIYRDRESPRPAVDRMWKHLASIYPSSRK